MILRDVHRAILDYGLTPVADWRHLQGSAQSDLARYAGLSKLWVNRIDPGKGHGMPAVGKSFAHRARSARAGLTAG